MKKLNYRIKEHNGKFTIEKRRSEFELDLNNLLKYLLVKTGFLEENFFWWQIGFLDKNYTFNTIEAAEKALEKILEEPKYHYFE